MVMACVVAALRDLSDIQGGGNHDDQNYHVAVNHTKEKAWPLSSHEFGRIVPWFMLPDSCTQQRSSIMLTLLIVVLLILLVFGGGGYYGYRREYYGPSGFGVIGLILVVLLLLALFGGPGWGWYHY
jgi:hypothetical protein